ncbi:hypothetical protein BLNAU_13259 [Blattamonas nauphoetae]|uniref:Uncharacterized protein n=1 Tax=Blattamonas nauphoetae TaxID=2049346 RepID=A0ABQ9XIA4_9EUKA|nr:hypothetical protein BLNAU_13259 [Blattamonas nauphoetae]
MSGQSDEEPLFMTVPMQNVWSIDTVSSVFSSIVDFVRRGGELTVQHGIKISAYLQRVEPGHQGSLLAPIDLFYRIAPSEGNRCNGLKDVLLTLLGNKQQIAADAALRLMVSILHYGHDYQRLEFAETDIFWWLPADFQTTKMEELPDRMILFAEAMNDIVAMTTPDHIAGISEQRHSSQDDIHHQILHKVIRAVEPFLWTVSRHWGRIPEHEDQRFVSVLFSLLVRVAPFHGPTTEFVRHLPVHMILGTWMEEFTELSMVVNCIYSLRQGHREWRRHWSWDVRQRGREATRRQRAEGFEDEVERCVNLQRSHGYFSVLFREIFVDVGGNVRMGQ